MARSIIGRTGLVYGLVDPNDGMLIYVGATTQKLETRVHGHVLEAENLYTNIRTPLNFKRSWILDLLAQGQHPLAVVFQEVEISGYVDLVFLGEAEVFWMAYFEKMGFVLANVERKRSAAALAQKVRRSLESEEEVISVVKENPTATDAAIARVLGCSERRVRNNLNRLVKGGRIAVSKTRNREATVVRTIRVIDAAE